MTEILLLVVLCLPDEIGQLLATEEKLKNAVYTVSK